LTFGKRDERRRQEGVSVRQPGARSRPARRCTAKDKHRCDVRVH